MNTEFPNQMISNKAPARGISTRPFVITFSGIDGAGKTTQIEYLSSSLQKQGFRVARLSFWDHIAVWSKMRAGVGDRSANVRPGNEKAQTPFAPKNNKSVRKWYLTAARSGFYMLDVARLRRILASPQIKSCDVVIFDRYVYDQIANIYSPSFAARIYGRVLLKLTPAPDLAFVVDASPDAAFARKPEYSLEFMHKNRQTFLLLQEIVPQLIIVPGAGAEQVRSDINSHISRSRLGEGTLPEGKADVPAECAVVPL
jgi:thymidylate kinase